MAYFVLDYLVAYGSIALAGLFKPLIFKENMETKKDYAKSIMFFVLAIVMGCFTRLLGGVLSSLIVYPLLSGDGPVSLWFAISYNSAYILPSAGFTIAVMLILYYPLLRIQKTFPVKDFKIHFDKENC